MRSRENNGNNGRKEYKTGLNQGINPGIAQYMPPYPTMVGIPS